MVTLRDMSNGSETTIRAKYVVGRDGARSLVRDVIHFFLSDAAKYVNGAVLPVDGGTRAAYKTR